MMWLPPLSAELQNVRETLRVSGCSQCAAAVRVHSYCAPMKSRLHTGARKSARCWRHRRSADEVRSSFDTTTKTTTPSGSRGRTHGRDACSGCVVEGARGAERASEPCLPLWQDRAGPTSAAPCACLLSTIHVSKLLAQFTRCTIIDLRVWGSRLGFGRYAYHIKAKSSRAECAARVAGTQAPRSTKRRSVRSATEPVPHGVRIYTRRAHDVLRRWAAALRRRRPRLQRRGSAVRQSEKERSQKVRMR